MRAQHCSELPSYISTMAYKWIFLTNVEIFILSNVHTCEIRNLEFSHWREIYLSKRVKYICIYLSSRGVNFGKWLTLPPPQGGQICILLELELDFSH